MCTAECKAHVTLEGEVEERDGYKFPKFSSLKIIFTVGKGTVQLKNLFGGDKVLGKCCECQAPYPVNLNSQFHS
jgi:hypothetical protein